MTDDRLKTIRQAFESWEKGDQSPFFDLIDDDVTWTVIGTTQASGVFRSKQALIDNAFGPLLARLDGPLKVSFVDLASDQDKVFLQFTSSGRSRTGVAYDQSYCFAMLMNGARIVEITAYLDTDVLRRVME